MKKIVIIILIIIISISMFKIQKEDTIIIPDNALRLRIIPNSNSAIDQNMKLKVKEYLENNTYSLIKDEVSLDDARKIIKDNIPSIKKNIEKIFDEDNYDMSYTVNYGYNYFPKKEYKGIKYNEGYYESIVISIGKAEGDNWWCVLFPNLCLVDLKKTNNIEYRSWIIEKINKII